jgi:hypothetical protein
MLGGGGGGGGGGGCTPSASLLNVDDHCFEDFRYEASIRSIYPRQCNNEEINLHAESSYRRTLHFTI